jgi:DNA-binding HxlR family transcriptional regulator
VAARDYGQYGGITQALELVGERWALLIVRDLLVGPRRYGELAAGLPRIPTNILATRLKELQAAGIIRRAPRSRIIIYELTPYGRELEPVVLALGAWGFKSLGDPRDEQVITADSMTIDLRTAFQPRIAETLPATAYAGRFGAAELLIRVDGSALDVSRRDSNGGGGVVDLSFAAGADIRRLISGELAPARAIQTGVIEVLGGAGALLDRFATTFHLAA